MMLNVVAMMIRPESMTRNRRQTDRQTDGRTRPHCSVEPTLSNDVSWRHWWRLIDERHLETCRQPTCYHSASTPLIHYSLHIHHYIFDRIYRTKCRASHSEEYFVLAPDIFPATLTVLCNQTHWSSQSNVLHGHPRRRASLSNRKWRRKEALLFVSNSASV